MKKMIDEGFIHRDERGNKFWYIYGDDRQEMYDSRVECDRNVTTETHQIACTEEGDFYIIGVGPIQYSRAGFKTEALCGHRCHWRHVVYLGKPVRPTRVNKKEYLIR